MNFGCGNCTEYGSYFENEVRVRVRKKIGEKSWYGKRKVYGLFLKSKVRVRNKLRNMYGYHINLSILSWKYAEISLQKKVNIWGKKKDYRVFSFIILSISTEKEREKYGYGYGYGYGRKIEISCTGKERVRMRSIQEGTEKGTGTGHFTLWKYGNGYGFKLSWNSGTGTGTDTGEYQYWKYWYGFRTRTRTSEYGANTLVVILEHRSIRSSPT